MNASPDTTISLLSSRRAGLPSSILLESKPARLRRPPHLVRVGNAVVKIYGRGPYQVDDKTSGLRKLIVRAKFKDAESLAQRIATNLANGKKAQNDFTESQRASHYRCEELAHGTGAPPELLVSEAVECRKICGQRISPVEACRAWANAHPAGIEEKYAPEIVEEYTIKHPACSKWARNRAIYLRRFSQKFPGPLTMLTAKDIDDWLDGLKVGKRTRRNHRDALNALFAYARFRRYLPKDNEPLDGVSDPEPDDVEFDPYTPEELAILLAKAESSKSGRRLVPLICVTAFAGVRHGEMNEEKIRLLDWSDFDWDTKRIEISRKTAKGTKQHRKARVVDMPDNLIEWLQPYRRPSGKICDLKCTHDALCKLRQKAGIRGRKRNALRKSFITYHKSLGDAATTAGQAGNSPQMIAKYYDAPTSKTKELALRWFSIRPVRADVLPLWQYAKAMP